MPIITERGRIATAKLDERGKIIFSTIDEQGRFIFGVQGGAPSAKYLQLDGIDDYITTPNMPDVVKIVMDFTFYSTQAGARVYFIKSADGHYNYIRTDTFAFGRNGIVEETYNTGVPLTRDTRTTFYWNTPSDVGAFDFFKYNAYFGKVDLFKITGIDVNGNVKFLYDMSTGALQDQTGNGNHATLNGGTWLDDAPSGQAYTKTLSDAVTQTDSINAQYIPYIPEINNFTKLLTDAFSITDGMIRQVKKTKSDVISTSDTTAKFTIKAKIDTVTQTDSINAQYIPYIPGINHYTKSLMDNILMTDAIVKRIISISKADNVGMSEVDSQATNKRLLDQITAADFITKSKERPVVLSDGLFVVDSISKVVSRLQTDAMDLLDDFNRRVDVSLRLYEDLLTSDYVKIFNPNAISTIHLTGSKEIWKYNMIVPVYVYGKRFKRIYPSSLDNMASSQHFSLLPGMAHNITISMKNGNLVSGLNFKWMVTSSSGIVLQKEGITTSAGEMKITIFEDETSSMLGHYYHEGQIRDRKGNIYPVVSGIITC
jgi:hypothetical protein